MGQVFAGRAPASLVSKIMISHFWAEAPIEWCVLAWEALAGRTTNDRVDARFRTEVGSITPEERACMLGYRLAAAHGHYEASQVPGPWSAVWALRGGVPVEWHDDGLPGIAISSIRQHITGTGRLRWEARGDGSLLIEVWRGPAGDAEPHRVLSAVIPTETPAYSASPAWEDWIDPSFISIKAYAPYGRRHLDVLVNAISTAVRRSEDDIRDLYVMDMQTPDFQCTRIGCANPELDPWDEATRPAWPTVGDRVHAVTKYGHGFDGPVTQPAAYCFEKKQWCVVVMDGETERFIPVGDISPIEVGA